MLLKLLQQFLKFSRENWWIYPILILALGLVIYTGRGNVGEIIFLFVLNILGNICFMLMLDFNNKKEFSIGASYYGLGNVFFVTLTVYGYLQNNEIQYVLWQIPFILGGIKNVLRYCYNRDVSYINVYTLALIGGGILMYVVQFGVPVYALLQSIGFAGVTTGLVSRNDMSRFFLMLIGTMFIVAGSLVGVWINYMNGNLLGITLSYALLTLATFIFYLKLLPDYISRLKKL